MVRISRILVAGDGSKNADRTYQYAAHIAKQCEVERLFLINVLEGMVVI